jgi:hypothetical protein
MTGVNGAINRPREIEIPSLKKVAEGIFRNRRPHSATKTRTLKAEETVSKNGEKGKALAMSILEAQRNSAVTLITGKSIETRYFEALVHLSRRNKIKKASAQPAYKK